MIKVRSRWQRLKFIPAIIKQCWKFAGSEADPFEKIWFIIVTIKSVMR